MTILTDPDLDFARQHLNRFADSDFFPPLFEYDAIWTHWDEFKTEAKKANISKLVFPTPLQLPAPKPNNTFRIVHQLDPLSCIAYTALAHSICNDLEAKRPDKQLKISCSYRTIPDSGSFFSDGTGYQEYLEQTRHLCDRYKYILSTDISDFYNQIYSHRVRNSISGLGPSWEDIAKDVESIVHSLNSGASKGIPTGPNASTIFSEAILLDVDSLLLNKGVTFCRFVDDVRMFSDDQQDLKKTIESLSEYLYDLACTRFRRHQDWCDNGTGGAVWRQGDSLLGSSSLRLFG
jgi:Reverse transcriptase (RNA-dependent DNA polymerase)